MHGIYDPLRTYGHMRLPSRMQWLPLLGLCILTRASVIAVHRSVLFIAPLRLDFL